MHENVNESNKGQITPAAKSTDMSFAKNTLQTNMYFPELHMLPIQYKLSVGAVDDPLEAEADAMADKMRMPEQNFIQRKCAHCEEEEKLQRKAHSFTSVIQKKCSHCGEEEKAQRKPLTSFIQKSLHRSGFP